jgi:hypothetical protein
LDQVVLTYPPTADRDRLAIEVIDPAPNWPGDGNDDDAFSVRVKHLPSQTMVSGDIRFAHARLDSAEIQRLMTRHKRLLQPRQLGIGLQPSSMASPSRCHKIVRVRSMRLEGGG